ncbi:methyltransferase [Pseudomonas sp. JL972]|uniref:methyltransferase n=1 Tax=Stutzerimonas degradans TaxID=2968968 RepID=UPI0012D8F58E|nr:methyltransferase [Stutzerimonas degradans]MTZ14927.1 methyltransferase [Stutzerimonas degradans]
MMKAGRPFLLTLLIFMFFSQAARASEIYVYFGKYGSWYSDAKKSATEACKAIFEGNTLNYKYLSTGAGTTGGSCFGSLITGSGQSGVGTWERRTLVCEHGSSDGLTCDPRPEPNQCEATNGQSVQHEHLMKSAVGQPTIDPPGSVCGNGCQYAFTYTAASNVYVYSSGNPPGVFGVYSYSGNGIQCNESTLKSPGDPSAGDTQNPDDTPPPDTDNKCPEGYTYNGTFCSPNTPPPDPDGPTDPTDPTDPADPGDGSGDGGGGGGGGGSDGGGSGDGSGSGDGDGSGDGEGDGSGDGDGSGGGGGTGTGDGEGEGEEEGAGSGPGFCDGDECGFVPPTYFDGAKKVPGFEQSLTRIFDGISSSPLGSSVTAIAFPSSPGVCPAGTVNLFGKPITFDGHCALWGEISGIFSALMLAVWCLLGVRIVLSS